MSLDAHLWVAQIAAPRTDPAFDRSDREAWLVAAKRYTQTRSPADLAALPLLEGRKPRLYAVRVLSPEAYTAVKAQGTVEQRDLLACRAGVAAYKDTDGRTFDAPLEAGSPGAAPVATAAWLKTLQSLGGGQLLQELAAVVLRRYEIGDVDTIEGADPLDLYHLGGLRLARSTG